MSSSECSPLPEARPVYETVPLGKVENERSGNTTYFICSPPWANAFRAKHIVKHGPFNFDIEMAGLSKKRKRSGSGDFGSTYLLLPNASDIRNPHIQYPWTLFSECFDHVTPTQTIKDEWYRIIANREDELLYLSQYLGMPDPYQILSGDMDVTGSFMQYCFHIDRERIMRTCEATSSMHDNIARKSKKKLDIHAFMRFAEADLRAYAKELFERYYKMTMAISPIFSDHPLSFNVADELGIPLYEHDLLAYAMNGPVNIASVSGGLYDGQPYYIAHNMDSQADVVSTTEDIPVIDLEEYWKDKNSFIDYLISKHQGISKEDSVMADRQKSGLLILKMIFGIYGHSPHYRLGDNPNFIFRHAAAALNNYKIDGYFREKIKKYTVVNTSDGARNPLGRALDRSVVYTSSNRDIIDILEQGGEEALLRKLELLEKDDRIVVSTRVTVD